MSAQEMTPQELEAIVERARAEEREACAAIAEEFDRKAEARRRAYYLEAGGCGTAVGAECATISLTANEIAVAIRARKP